MNAAMVQGTSDLAAALAAEIAVGRVDGDALVLVASGDVATLIEGTRASTAQAIVIVVEMAAMKAIDAHLLIAAIEPLAIELAPQQRLCAVQVQPEVEMEDVLGTIAYLIGAKSVTGQVIRIDHGVWQRG